MAVYTTIHQRRGGVRTYFSTVLPKENSHPEDKQPAAKRKKLVFPVAAENPPVLISSAGDELLTLRQSNKRTFVR